MTPSNRTVIFWGAGATASLGMPLTDSQARFILGLAATGSGSAAIPLPKRVHEALQGAAVEPWNLGV